ncbi:MAG: phosphatidate cytidylyltransferase [Rhodothermales bacterium]
MPDAPAPIPYRGELWRKALHILTAMACPFLLGLLGLNVMLWLTGTLAALAVAADVARTYSPGFQAFIDGTFGFMMRSEESEGRGPVFNGATWVLIAITLLLLVFPANLALPIFIMFMLADAAAALIGRRYGRHVWAGGQRTLEGSAAFFIVAVVVLSGLTALPWWLIVGASLAAALFEAVDVQLNDNLIVPFLTTLLVSLVLQFGMGQAVNWLPIF